MAHRLMIQDDRAALMYVGAEPWHGLGQKLDEPATAEEAIKAALLDWEVLKLPLYARGKDGFAARIPGKYATVPGHLWGREGCPTFGIVGPDYRPLQNREAFSFFDPIVGEGAAVYHTAGAIDQGKRVWILAKLPGHIEVTDQDITDKYLLLSNSHDGEGSIQVKFSPVRVVCANTLSQALSEGPALRVSHTPDLDHRLQQARGNLKLINAHYQRTEKTFRAMASLKLSNGQLATYIEKLFPWPKKTNDAPAMRRVARDRATVARFSAEGTGNQLPGVKGSLWTAYNGVTEFVDAAHTRTAVGTHLVR